MSHNQSPSAWQPKLPFEQDEIWTGMPEQSQERCRKLLSQVLRSVLRSEPRRQDERED